MLPRKLHELTQIPNLTDLLISGTQPVLIDRGQGLEEVPNPYRSVLDLQRDMVELSYEQGVRLDLSHPMADLVLGNLRLHLLLPFGIAELPQVSIRVHGRKEQAFEGPHLELLQSLAREHKTILICGATGAGKTTLARTLLQGLHERIITIEQTPELRLGGRSITLFCREPNQEGRGEVTLSDLVTQSLRMRPDRIVVGEVRGHEFGAFLLAVSSGHPGAITTLHAKSLDSVAARLEILGLLSGFEVPLTARLVAQCVDIVVVLENQSGQRVISEVGRPVIESGSLEVRSIL